MNYQYDLFISFKNSTEAGLTEDREAARRIFNTLTRNNFKVFFSNTVLADKGIANYMLEIQSALEMSKALLVIYSHIDYISKGWVAQEWMTFLNLLMKDPNRSIYIFSLNKDTANLPPFLRPYECFEDYHSAITHLTNGMRNQTAAAEPGIAKREFLNAYWGLFENTDIYDYINRPMSENFYNYPVYCLKSAYINGGNTQAYINGLKQIIENEKNPLASYLLSRHYRNVNYLDLAYSRKLSKAAFESFKFKIRNSSPDSEVGLWILTDTPEYDGAFYMCDVIHDVLDAYDVKTDIKVLSPGMLEAVNLQLRRKIVLFWSDVCLDIPESFVEKLQQYKDNILIGLNSFGEGALTYDIKNCSIFENHNMDITRVCRILLS
ncbi:hypothetical protein B5E77_10180 [Lachnoclostridium sp. An131]|uniref:toll/interleukin-1 receptor domain-containing protein n=1 Tax=Lachnoclostridium sp. An131 TaxID=1965555 RepID=UPI000B369DE4|nr:toll/interleukin-1 receptor domain-containing protein [Lachnoclostridium sp. An131]OUQ25837.1 hypothetical protein B5E77_10180 [Lachnoclostridium sp. An131]